MDRVDDGKKALVSGCSVSPRLVWASDSWELGTVGKAAAQDIGLSE